MITDAVFDHVLTLTGLPLSLEGGASLFKHKMPSRVKEGVLLLEPLSGQPIDHYLPGYFKGSLQVIVRAKGYKRSQEIANALSTALHIEGIRVGDVQINYLRPRHTPVLFPRSEGDVIEASVNFDAGWCV